MCFPEAMSGEYWLDPNGGSVDDAMAVHCNFDLEHGKVETCVNPTTVFAAMMMKQVKPDNLSHMWMAKTIETETEEIGYGTTASQWRRLAVGMKSAHQDITYNCKNSPAHRTMSGQQKAFIQLLSKDNHVLNTEAPMDERVQVISDSCFKEDGLWHQAVFKYTTQDISRLPIRDIGVLGSGTDNEEFSIHVGKVCFST